MSSIVDIIGESFTNANVVDDTFINKMKNGNEIKYNITTVRNPWCILDSRDAVNTSYIKGMLLLSILGFINKCRYKPICEFDSHYENLLDDISLLDDCKVVLPVYFSHIMLKKGGNSISTTIKDFVFDIVSQMEYNKFPGAKDTIASMLYGVNNMTSVIANAISKNIVYSIENGELVSDYTVVEIERDIATEHQTLLATMQHSIPAIKSFYKHRKMTEANKPFYRRTFGKNIKYIDKIVEEVTLRFANYERDYYIFKVIEEVLEVWDANGMDSFEVLDLLITSLILENTNIPIKYYEKYHNMFNSESSLLSGIVACDVSLRSTEALCGKLADIVFIDATDVGKTYYKKIRDKLKKYYI